MSALASVTDLLLYDLKFVDTSSHLRYAGVPNHQILRNLERLAALGHDIHVRVPCIPGVSDAEEQIAAIARFVTRLEINEIVLLPYNAAAGAKYQWIGRPYALSDKETQSEEYMDSLADLCRREGLVVQVGG